MEVNPQPPYKQFKYRLKECWASYFGADGPDMKKKFLQENPPLHKITMTNDFNIKKTDAETIPAERLKKYADFLNTTVEALRNYLSIAA